MPPRFVDWHAVIDLNKGTKITYDIANPLEDKPDRLVLTETKWIVYKSDGLGGYGQIAEGPLASSP
jgi:hypothetical protein